MLNDPSLSSPTPDHWSPNTGATPTTDWSERILGWWFRMTTPPGLSTASTYIDRVQYQKARRVSTMIFIDLLLITIFGYLVIHMSLPTIISYLLTYPICFLALFINRNGMAVLAGILPLLIFEVGLASTMLAFPALDTSNLPLYGSFVIGELLAASLLPVSSIFVVALLNSAFIVGDLLLQPHTQELGYFLHQQFALAVAVPLILQLVVAGVISLWIYNSAYANERANRAEMVATLEHTVAEQLEEENKAKLELETSVQQLVEEHAHAANNRFVTRISYPPAKVLWPLVGVVNALATRLQHAEKSDRELEQLRQAIIIATEMLHQAALSPQKSPLLRRTGTEVDLLALEIKRLHEATAQANQLSSNG